MSLESITAEWDELSKEYNKLEVGDNILFIFLLLNVIKKVIHFHLRAAFVIQGHEQ